MTLPLKPLSSLRQLSLRTIADNFERFMIPYHEKWKDVFIDKRPTFGPFVGLESNLLALIIEELIKREKLTYERLSVLLPEDAEIMTCDENTRFSPFGCNTIDLISQRCPNFKILHCHYDFVRESDGVLIANIPIKESIRRLKLLQEINFCDTWITYETIKNIALNCLHLRELNLQRTNLDAANVDCLLAEESVIKNSLTKLIVDENNLLVQSVEQCLLSLPNLTHFQSDRTIEAALQLFEKFSSAEADVYQKCHTIICKNKFMGTKVSLTEDSMKWLVKKFPKVKHLNISLQQVYNKLVSVIVISLKHITHLELSSSDENATVSNLLPAIVSCQNLVTLKMENFSFVDVTTLGNKLKKLEKLILINNSILRSDEIEFESLKELQIIFLEDNFEKEFLNANSELMHIRYYLLLSILASKNIEKLLFYNQNSFISPLMKELLEEGHLRNLKELKVFKCLLEMDCIWELFSQAIPVKDIVVGFCRNIKEEDVNQITNYCKENNLAASISQTWENPYYLRWLVQ